MIRAKAGSIGELWAKVWAKGSGLDAVSACRFAASAEWDAGSTPATSTSTSYCHYPGKRLVFRGSLFVTGRCHAPRFVSGNLSFSQVAGQGLGQGNFDVHRSPWRLAQALAGRDRM